MSLEDKIEALTKAVEASTAALTAGGAAPAATTTAKAGKTKTTETTAPTTTREEMVAALNEVKEKKGVSDAKALIKDVGKADKMADISDKLIDAVFKAAQAKLAEEEGM
jgi:hypothetical protein